MRLQHSIRKQTLALVADSEALALALQPRLSDINRRRLLSVIEQVLDEFAAPGRQIKIPRLDLDLGLIQLEGFEEEAAARLDRALRRALEEVARDEGDAQVFRSQTEEAAHFELLEYYLLRGTLPFWASRVPDFSLEELVTRLMAADPQGMEAVIRRHGRHARVLERLVLQLGEATLRRLIRLLEPRHAALIIIYMIDLRAVHSIAPVLTVSDRRFARLLWLLVLSYLVRDAGSQFNRKSFVRSLLETMAESEGLDYVKIITTLDLGLRETARKRSFKSSLPAIISELVSELVGESRQSHVGDETPEEPATDLPDARARKGRAGPHLEGRTGEGRSRPPRHFARYDEVAVLCYYLRHGVLPWDALVNNPSLTPAGALAVLPGLPRSMIHAVFMRARGAAQPEAILRAVRGLPEEGTAWLLRTLLPRSQRPDDPLRSALTAFAGRAADKHQFYARLIAATLDGRPLDLEEFASHAPALRPRAASPPDYGREAHVLKSALATHLRLRDASGASRQAEASLLRALVERHPADARYFLRSIRGVTPMLTAVAGRCPADLFADVLDLLCPRGAATLTAVARIFARIPAPYRPQSEEGVRRALLEELLLLKEGQPLTEGFFASLLRRLCGGPPSERICQLLTHEAATLSASDQLTAAHLAAFVTSLASAATRAEADADESLADAAAARHAKRIGPPIPREAVFTFLLGEHRAPQTRAAGEMRAGRPRAEQLSKDALLHALNVMLEEFPEEISAFISRHMAEPLRRERWAKVLPESALVRLSYVLEPRKHRALLRVTEALASAWLEAVPHGHPTLTSRELFWSFLLEFLDRNTGTNRSVGRLALAFSEFFAARYLAATSGVHDGAGVGSRLLEHAWRLAGKAGLTSLLATLRRDRALLLAPWEPTSAHAPTPPADAQREAAPRPPTPTRGRRQMAFGMKEEEEETGAAEPIYIENAGLVLTGPFLPHLFQTLDMLSTGENARPRLRDVEAVSRAVHMLQYLIDGRTDAPEPLLVLNKILCGVAKGTPVEPAVELDERERETCGKLLKSLLSNWKLIEHTSVAGLQETFMRRAGRLEQTEDGWKLRVQRKTVDVLVDHIPWNVSLVYHRWMPQPLYIDW